MNSKIDEFKVARQKARRLAEGMPERLKFARGFMASALSSYAVGVRGPVEPINHPLAVEIARLAGHFELETAAYLLGTVYTVMLPSDYRTERGVFYTPPAASSRLLALAEASGIRWQTAQVADISCGGGAFIAPVAIRILSSRNWGSARAAAAHLRTHLHGFEIDPFSAWMAEIFLTAVFRAAFPDSSCSAIGCVEVADSLARPLAQFGTFDLVIGNPPYGKIRLTAEERMKWARSLYGHANLYGLFTDLAVRLLKHRGVVAYVTPASFLGGQYFERLRGLLAKECPPRAIDFLASRDAVFADALQEAVLVTFQKCEVRDFPVSFTQLTETGPALVTDGGLGSLPSDGATPWLLPRAVEHVALLNTAKQLPYRLRDYGYEVSTGPLVWNRHKEQLGNARTTKSIPVVWAECVNPHGTGEFTLKADTRNHATWYIPSGSDDSNIVRAPCVLVQRTTAKEQRRRLFAAALPEAILRKHGGVAVENHLNMLWRRKADSSVVPEAELVALLNSEAVDQVFRCINGSTAVSAYELESVPLPDPAHMRHLAALLKRHAPREEIEAFIHHLYANVRIDAAA